MNPLVFIFVVAFDSIFLFVVVLDRYRLAQPLERECSYGNVGVAIHFTRT